MARTDDCGPARSPPIPTRFVLRRRAVRRRSAWAIGGTACCTCQGRTGQASPRFGPDIAFLDQALDRVFGRFSVDPSRVSIEGFSDGASYALSVGLTNGDLFSRIVAFSPGFMAPGERRGQPGIFVSHGVGDDVLPINRCSRRIVPRLHGDGYSVHYREFFGGHTVPDSIAREAEAWVTAREVAPER